VRIPFSTPAVADVEYCRKDPSPDPREPESSSREAGPMIQSVVVDWDSTALPAELQALLPAELRDLPPGRYVVEPLVDDDDLTPEEEEGILEAIAEIEAGLGIPAEEARRQLRVKRGW